MGLLKEFFKPKNKKDAVTIAVIFIALGGFTVFEVAAFAVVMENPKRLDVWSGTQLLPTEWVLTLANTKLFTTPAEYISTDTIFYISLSNLANEHVRIELEFKNCMLERIIYASGHTNVLYSELRYYIDDATKLTMDNNSLDLTLGEMDYPHKYDILFIRVTDMGNSGVELLYKASII